MEVPTLANPEYGSYLFNNSDEAFSR